MAEEVDKAAVDAMATAFLSAPSAPTASAIADLCRNEKTRFKFVSHEALIPSLVAFMRSQVLEAVWDGVVASLRAIGNLTYEIDRNRTQVLAAEAVGDIVRLLSSPNPAVRRVATGVVTNLLYKSDDVHAEVMKHDVISLLMRLLGTDEDVLIMALRAVGNLAGDSDLQSVFMEHQLVPTLMSILKANLEDDDVIPEVLLNLCNLIDVPEYWALMKEADVVNTLVSIVTNFEREDDTRSKASDLLINISKLDSLRPDVSHLYPLALKMNRSDDVIVHGTGIMLLAHASLDQSGSEKLFASLPEIRIDQESTNMKVQLGQAMLIGNLPRSDEEALKLSKNDDIVSLLVRYLRTAEDDRVRHLAAAGLRNLSIPAENKRLLVDLGLIPDLIRVANDSKNAPAIYECVRCLKSLVADSSYHALFLREGGLACLKEINEKSFQEGQERVYLEASRIWVILSEHPENIPSLVEQDAYAPPLLRLLDSTFPLLQMEGAKAFHTILSAHSPSPVNLEVAGKLSSLLRSTNSKEVRTWAAKALDALVSPLSHADLSAFKECEDVAVSDLVSAFSTVVFDDDAKESVDRCRGKLS